MSDTMAEKLKRKLNAKSVTAIILFGAIIMVFVFFGMPGQMGGGIGSVARVNNTLISVGDFQQETERIQQYYQNLFGSQMDFSSQRQLLRQQAMESLVRLELVSQGAEKNGILATDAEIRDYIVNDVPFLQSGGQFQRDLYNNYLASRQLTPGKFEGKIRKEIVNIRARRMFEMASQPSVVEVAKIHELRSQKINVSFVHIDQAAADKALTPEGAAKAMTALDEALVKGDEATVNAQLKVLKANWEETGLIELAADNVPKIQSESAVDAISELTKSEPLLKRLVRDGNSKYVLKLKDSLVEAPKVMEKSALEMMQKRRGDGMFEAWVNQFRARSTVTMNSQALQM